MKIIVVKDSVLKRVTSNMHRIRLRNIRSTMQRAQLLGTSGLLVFSLLLSGLSPIKIVDAASGQGGTSQVTLNPGGGLLANGSDGLRFTINADYYETESYEEDYNYVSTAGQDSPVYMGTRQYCCGAGAPMLNIGGELFGQAGAARSASNWSSIQVISTSGTTSTGARTSAVGSASATVRYTATVGELSYVMDRQVNYTHPNNYVTENYTFIIPEGNTDAVKFYQGGDTSPGSSDDGFGVMKTSPVRTIISVNPYNGYQFGFREVEESKSFDGANSQYYSENYEVLVGGGNIGFAVDEEDHDAGLMMQWDLGSTPGTFNASMEQFVTVNSASLDMEFTPTEFDANDTTDLKLTLTNDSDDSNAYATGFYVGVPSGLYIAGDITSNCGGEVNIWDDDDVEEFNLWGVELAPGADCITTVPLGAYEAGVYTITGEVGEDYLYDAYGGVKPIFDEASVTFTSNFNSDKNGDNINDDSQDNVLVLENPVTDQVTVLEVDEQCSIEEAFVKSESTHTVQDPKFDYPSGLVNFTIDCGDPGYTATIKQYYYDVASNDNFTLRKHNTNSDTYFNIPDAQISTVANYERTAVLGTYQVTDGGDLDMDGEVDGVIIDPAGLALAATTTSPTPGADPAAGTPDTGFQQALSVLVMGAAFTAGAGLLVARTMQYRRQKNVG